MFALQHFGLFSLCFFYSHTAQSKDSKDKEEFECPTNWGNGNFADPVTCRRFYQVDEKLRQLYNIHKLFFGLNFPLMSEFALCCTDKINLMFIILILYNKSRLSL